MVGQVLPDYDSHMGGPGCFATVGGRQATEVFPWKSSQIQMSDIVPHNNFGRVDRT